MLVIVALSKRATSIRYIVYYIDYRSTFVDFIDTVTKFATFLQFSYFGIVGDTLIIRMIGRHKGFTIKSNIVLFLWCTTYLYTDQIVHIYIHIYILN